MNLIKFKPMLIRLKISQIKFIHNNKLVKMKILMILKKKPKYGAVFFQSIKIVHILLQLKMI
jgi:hypothetical protein